MINKSLKIRTRYTWLILSLLLSLGMYPLYSQEHVDFGQYSLFQPMVNIAAAGSYTQSVISVYGRTQWTSIEGAPTKLGTHFILPFSRNSIGISLNQETIGVHSRQVAIANYTHKVDFTGENHLAFGLGLGVEMVNSKFTEALPNESQDLSFGKDKSSIGAEMNFGIYFYGKNSYAGFSIPSLIYNEIVENEGILSGNTQLASKYWQYYFLGGYKFHLSNNLDLGTSSLVKLYQNAPVEVDLNTQFIIDEKLSLGISYRTKREALFLINYNFLYRMSIGYSYHSYFGINSHLLSGHEIICVFHFSKFKEANIQTPRF